MADRQSDPLLRSSNSHDDHGRMYRVSQSSEVLLLLLQALGSLIFRLWLATVTISMLMYFVRRVSIHNIRHQNGQLISDRVVNIVNVGAEDIKFVATPALFGQVLKDSVRGIAF